MNRRRRLGQHFLESPVIAAQIVEAAGIGPEEDVLEIGTGRGILTPGLCKAARAVVSVEADPVLYREARAGLSSFDNLELIHGDGFETDREFSILVSNLPYSQSRTAIEWLARQRFTRAIIMVQEEFADKMSNGDRAISAIADYCFVTERVIRVRRSNFSPPPKVDSVVLRITHRHALHADTVRAVNLMFSYRRKTVSNVMARLGVGGNSSQSRLEDLKADDIIGLGMQISGRRRR